MEKYNFEPWKKYRLPDNGIYAPMGSSPTFHTESRIMTSELNPIHPHIKGYIMHDAMKGDDMVYGARVLWYEIGEKIPK